MTHAMVFTAVSVDVSIISYIAFIYMYILYLYLCLVFIRKTVWRTSCAWRTRGAKIAARRATWWCAPTGSGSLGSRSLWTRSMCPRMCCACSIWIPLCCPPGIPWARWRNRCVFSQTGKALQITINDNDNNHNQLALYYTSNNPIQSKFKLKSLFLFWPLPDLMSNHMSVLYNPLYFIVFYYYYSLAVYIYSICYVCKYIYICVCIYTYVYILVLCL